MDPDELLEVARQLVEYGAKKGVTLRILGHLSVRQHTAKANRQLIEMLKRVPTHDIDFMGYTKQTNLANHMFINELGYKIDPAVAYSQEYGIQRLIYYHDNGIMAEIFLDQLRMAHTLDFRGRLELDSPTISLVDIMLSKLQIVQITEKDLKDLIVLLAEHDLGSKDRERVDVDYLLKLTKEDWCLYYTTHTNLGKVREYLKTCDALDKEVKQRVDDRLGMIITKMEGEPKSLRWKARAKIGPRIKWYEDVGDVHRHGE